MTGPLMSPSMPVCPKCHADRPVGEPIDWEHYCRPLCMKDGTAPGETRCIKYSEHVGRCKGITDGMTMAEAQAITVNSRPDDG